VSVPRRGFRFRHTTHENHGFRGAAAEEPSPEDPTAQQLVCGSWFASCDVPKTYREATKRADFITRWKPACQEQVNKLTKAGTWELVNKPFDKTTLPGKWVFDQKFDPNGQ